MCSLPAAVAPDLAAGLARTSFLGFGPGRHPSRVQELPPCVPRFRVAWDQPPDGGGLWARAGRAGAQCPPPRCGAGPALGRRVPPVAESGVWSGGRGARTHSAPPPAPEAGTYTSGRRPGPQDAAAPASLPHGQAVPGGSGAWPRLCQGLGIRPPRRAGSFLASGTRPAPAPEPRLPRPESPRRGTCHGGHARQRFVLTGPSLSPAFLLPLILLGRERAPRGLAQPR